MSGSIPTGVIKEIVVKLEQRFTCNSVTSWFYASIGETVFTPYANYPFFAYGEIDESLGGGESLIIFQSDCGNQEIDQNENNFG